MTLLIVYQKKHVFYVVYSERHVTIVVNTHLFCIFRVIHQCTLANWYLPLAATKI